MTNKLEDIYNKLADELPKVAFNKIDKHLDRMVFIENKLKNT